MSTTLASISALAAPTVYCGSCLTATTDYATVLVPPAATGWVAGRRAPRSVRRHICTRCVAA